MSLNDEWRETKIKKTSQNRLIIRDPAWIKAELTEKSFAVAACFLWRLELSVFERWVAGKRKYRDFTKQIDHQRSCKTRGWTGRRILRRCYWVFLSGAWGEAENREASQNRLRSSIRKNSKGDQILAPNLAGPWEGSFDGEEMQLLRSCHNGGHTCRSVKEIRF